jgi:four helix bundle protein
MTKIGKLEELRTWQEAINLAKIVWQLLNKLPKKEYTLRKHMWECARNIPGNIAEGFGRQYSKESKQFYAIANGSLNELKSDLYLTHFVCEYFTKEEFDRAKWQVDTVGRLLTGLGKTVYKAKNRSK